MKPMANLEIVLAELQRRMDAMLALKQEGYSHKNLAIAHGFAPAYAEDDKTWKFSAMGVLTAGVICFSNETYVSEAEMWEGCVNEMELGEQHGA